jgi:hypothetical protein
MKMAENDSSSIPRTITKNWYFIVRCMLPIFLLGSLCYPESSSKTPAIFNVYLPL